MLTNKCLDAETIASGRVAVAGDRAKVGVGVTVDRTPQTVTSRMPPQIVTTSFDHCTHYLYRHSVAS